VPTQGSIMKCKLRRFGQTLSEASLQPLAWLWTIGGSGHSRRHLVRRLHRNPLTLPSARPAAAHFPPIGAATLTEGGTTSIPLARLTRTRIGGNHFSLGPASRVSARPGRCLITTTTPSAALIPAAPVFTNTERLALAGFLAGYSGLTRQAYELDLRQYVRACDEDSCRILSQLVRSGRSPVAGGRLVVR
jgi:hypothetical protein